MVNCWYIYAGDIYNLVYRYTEMKRRKLAQIKTWIYVYVTYSQLTYIYMLCNIMSIMYLTENYYICIYTQHDFKVYVYNVYFRIDMDATNI